MDESEPYQSSRRLAALMLASVVAVAALLAGCAEDANGGATAAPSLSTRAAEGGGVPPDAGDWASLVMTEYRFVPDVIETRTGQAIEIDVQNRGEEEHTFTLDAIAGELQVLGAPSDGVVDVVLSPDDSALVRLRPSTPGEYVFYCSIPGHREAGLEGLLVVEEPPTR